MANNGRGYWAGLVVAAIGLAMLASNAIGQDVPPAHPSNKAGLHQFGIICRGDLTKSLTLNLPEFVHRQDQPVRAGGGMLEFSALYFLPPLMMQGSMSFSVSQSLDKVSGWYPYAHETSNSKQRVWNDVLVGVQADGLETTNSSWLPGRRMEAASTLKVYKPGPDGSKPDDEGTTEGEVFIFLGGSVPDDGVRVSAHGGSEWWISLSHKLDNGTPAEFAEGTRQAWIVSNGPARELFSRRIMMPEPGEIIRTSGTVELEPFDKETIDLRMQLNEALVGNGLRSDEAEASAELILQMVVKARKPVLIYLVPQEWIEHAVPLAVIGPAEKPVRIFVTVSVLPG